MNELLQNELHGGNVYAYQDCCDFSANLNPLGMPEAVRQIVIENANLWAHYPDPYCKLLTERIAKSEQTKPESIVCGNGADDLIWRIVQSIRPKRALILTPCFSEYRRALEAFGCEVESFILDETLGFSPDEELLAALHPSLDLVILCSPNNPTGRLVPTDLLREISRICEKNETYLLTDECFLDFVPDGKKLSARQFMNNFTIVLNAFTKTFAMAGLRLGYAVFGSVSIAETVRKTGQYWSVSTPAQFAGMAALDQWDFHEKSRKLIVSEREYLMQELGKRDLKVYPSDANFLLFRARNGLRCDLIEEHILIRSCENMEGLDGTFYRIAVRTHSENELLLAALRRCL